MKKRVVVVERRASLREMLSWTLQSKAGYDVVAETGSGLEAVELCRRHRPNLLVLDLFLPELGAAEVIRRVHHQDPMTRTLIYGDCQSSNMVVEALRAKPNGFVDSSEPLSTVLGAIAAVAAGCSYFSPVPANMLAVVPADESSRISRREREVAQMIAEGSRSKDIAIRLGVSLKTVENHRTSVMQKLRVHGAAELTRYAVAHGWLSVHFSAPARDTAL